MEKSTPEHFDGDKKAEMAPVEVSEYKNGNSGLEVSTTRESVGTKEAPSDLNKKIKVLREEIDQIRAARQRVDRLQKHYAVPDDALTESDTALIRQPLESLEAQLKSLVIEKKKNRRSLKKIFRSFFSI